MGVRTVGLELCDAGSIATAGDGSDSWLIPLENDGAASPGFVYYDGERYVTGRQAENRSRIYPLHVSDNCWDQLSLRVSDVSVSGSSPFFSELAYHHLQHIWKMINLEGPVAKLVLAVPGNYIGTDEEEEKTGLILGMILHLNIPLAAIIDMAAASLIGHPELEAPKNRRALHLDVHQRKTVVTAFDLGPPVTRLLVTAIPIGYARIFNEITPKLANRFLTLTAFDVTHDAETEQQFYNQIKTLLAFLKDHEAVTLEMGGTRRPRKMEVYRDVAARHLDPVSDAMIQLLYRTRADAGIDESEVVTLFLTNRAGGIPGLAEKLSHKENLALEFLDPGAASEGAAHFGSSVEIIGDLQEASLTTGFDPGKLGPDNGDADAPNSAGDVESAAAPPVATTPAPTHIVYSGRAHRIHPAGLDIRDVIPGSGHGLRIKLQEGAAVLENLNSSTTLINHRPAESAEPLQIGDVLTLRGSEPGEERADLIVIFCDM